MAKTCWTHGLHFGEGNVSSDASLLSLLVHIVLLMLPLVVAVKLAAGFHLRATPIPEADHPPPPTLKEMTPSKSP